MTVDEILRAIDRKDLATLQTLDRGQADLRDGDGLTLLMHAVLADDADPTVVKTLIDRGTDVNAADKGQRWTALHFAARNQNEPLARLLLDAGAEVDPDDIFGDTPLWRSVMEPRSDLSVIKLLLAHGANPTRKNLHGSSPLDVARASGQDDVVQLLEREIEGRI